MSYPFLPMNPRPADLPVNGMLSAGTANGPLVCVVDEDSANRRGVERLLKSAGIAAETFASGSEYLARPPHVGPLCLVLELRPPDGADGHSIQEMLTMRGEQVVILTTVGDVSACARAMKAGAVDYLLKPASPETLLAAIRLGLTRAAAMLHQKGIAHEARKKVSALTPRESQVFERVVLGMLNKQIAADLGTAEKTIKTHRGRVMQKTGCASVPDLLRLAQLAGVEGCR